MKKKILCVALCLGLCVSLAQAAETSFTDVKDSDWFAPYVSICSQAGLMNGTGNGVFDPNGTITRAEVAAIAARLSEQNGGASIVKGTPLPGESLPWYHWYVEHLKNYQVTVADPEGNASRQDFISYLSAVTPPADLAAINSITALPDTADPGVLAFYNAGILTGVDQQGTFAGDRTLTRAEAAAMVARLTRSDLRLPFVPQAPAPEVPAQTPQSTAAMTVNSAPVSLDTVAAWALQIAYQYDYSLATGSGSRLDLSDPNMAQAVMNQALTQAAASVLLSDMASQMGCEVSALAGVLSPSPSREELSAYVTANDLLCAKHILVADDQTAQAVLDGLESVPTLEQFNALLYVFGSDPGMEQNPDGYLFTAGQMVPEFEAGVRGLEIGSYTAEPVQSTYGYHIIWRLDPADHPDLVESYQTSRLEDQINLRLQSADIVPNPELLNQLDLASLYSHYLTQLAAQQGQQ